MLIYLPMYVGRELVDQFPPAFLPLFLLLTTSSSCILRVFCRHVVIDCREHVGIVPDDIAGRRAFSGFSRFPRPCVPALLHVHLASPPTALKTPLLRARLYGDSSYHDSSYYERVWNRPTRDYNYPLDDDVSMKLSQRRARQVMKSDHRRWSSRLAGHGQRLHRRWQDGARSRHCSELICSLPDLALNPPEFVCWPRSLCLASARSFAILAEASLSTRLSLRADPVDELLRVMDCNIHFLNCVHRLVLHLYPFEHLKQNLGPVTHDTRMERHWNARAGDMGVPQENRPASGIVQNDSPCENPRVYPAGGERLSYCATARRVWRSGGGSGCDYPGLTYRPLLEPGSPGSEYKDSGESVGQHCVYSEHNTMTAVLQLVLLTWVCLVLVQAAPTSHRSSRLQVEPLQHHDSCTVRGSQTMEEEGLQVDTLKCKNATECCSRGVQTQIYSPIYVDGKLVATFPLACLCAFY
ncbi:hypothetical protein PR048_028018 [Dryococelus australis]|uniref:Uncharacterized protein n=1 Tax=Dryococelus australis TaxID=614101 RepID=A0ABQ9GI64_9NEOP|nr:hypothetical protein PR048_028018 [Dryococelus australis]